MKIGAVGFGSRTAGVYNEFSKVNPNFEMVAYVDPQPIGKDFAEKNNFFPNKSYSSLNEMLDREKLDMLMIGSPNHLHLDHIKRTFARCFFYEKLEKKTKIFWRLYAGKMLS